MSEIRERTGEARGSEEISSVRVGEVRRRRRAIKEELVRMTGEFERATEVQTPGRPFVPELRARRAELLEELHGLPSSAAALLA